MAELDRQSRYEAALRQLEAVEQAHVLRFYEELSEASRDRLLDQIESVDWPEVARLVESHVRQKPEPHLPETIEPAPWYPYEPGAEQAQTYHAARARGEALLRDGKVAAFTVAGGQGTRLGWDGPKGTFPATPVRGLPLFGCLAEYLQRAEEKFGAPIPWYVMTSPANDRVTRDFFREHEHFGLDPEQIMFFPQGMLPAFDMATGRALLEAKDRLALSPNGHGGSLKALHASGALEDMRRRGIEQISYTQVDNPLVRMVDPLFLGLHNLEAAPMSSKMLPKAHPYEKVGNLCRADGRVTVIEYSDLPAELAEQRDEDGELRFRAGSIAIHAIERSFVEELNRGGELALPFHRAEKKVPHIDLETGEAIKPEQPNAVKLEMFVFDALPLCENSVIYETDRIDEFAPIKNAEGDDSPATSKRIQAERAARWLERHHVTVPRDRDGELEATLELPQRKAIEPEDLAALELPTRIEAGETRLL